MPRDNTGPLGLLGFLATLTLGEINHVVGIAVGVLSAAYLVRKHIRFSKVPVTINKDE